MNKAYQKPIQKRLEDVKEAIKAYQKEADRQVAKYAHQYELKTGRLKEDALREEDMMDRAILMGALDFSRSQAELAITLAFEDIGKVVEEWVSQPPSAEFTAVMSTVDRFNLQLSRSEIEVLSTLASGSYIGQKVIDLYASDNAMSCNFQPVEKIRQQISAARSDALAAVHAYCTQDMTEYKWITDREYPTHVRVYAADYLERERTSLTDLWETLNAAMNPDVSLIPSEIERLEKFFDGHEDRVQRMQELILMDPDHADRFALYDPKSYKAARQIIAEQKMEQAAAARKAVAEAAKKATDAHYEAVKAKANISE